MEAASLLLAEDDEMTRRLLAAILTRGGHTVIEARNGEEAVDRVQRERPTLVLMDLDMPVLTGQEACHQLRQDRATAAIPIVAVTSRDYRRELEVLREIGFSGYLQKPFALADVENALESCLAAVARGERWCDIPPAEWNTQSRR